jgi:hypothetical protein
VQADFIVLWLLGTKVISDAVQPGPSQTVIDRPGIQPSTTLEMVFLSFVEIGGGIEQVSDA